MKAPHNFGFFISIVCKTSTMLKSYTQGELKDLGMKVIPNNFKGGQQEVSCPKRAAKLKSIGRSFSKLLEEEGFMMRGNNDLAVAPGTVFVPKNRLWKILEMEKKYMQLFKEELELLHAELDDKNREYRERYGLPDRIQPTSSDLEGKFILRVAKLPACLTISAAGVSLDDMEPELRKWATENEGESENAFFVECTNTLREMACEAAFKLDTQLQSAAEKDRLIGQRSIKAFEDFAQKFDEINWVGDNDAAALVGQCVESIQLYGAMMSSNEKRKEAEKDLSEALKTLMAMPKLNEAPKQQQQQNKMQDQMVIHLNKHAKKAVKHVSSGLEDAVVQDVDEPMQSNFRW